MDYHPRQQRNYNHYSNNNQPHPTSRSLDNRVKIPYYLPEEEISYDEGPSTRLENRGSMEGVYVDPENSGSRVLDNQRNGSRDINESHSQGLNTEPQAALGPAGSGDGPKIPKESSTNLTNDMTHGKQQSGKGPNMSRHGSTADKELVGVTNSKDTPGANLPLTDPNELRQKVVESLVEKKKKAQFFITQESEGIARKETSPESKIGSTGTNTSEIGIGIDKPQQKVSASNPEREAALDALLAAAMGSAKSVSGKPEKHQTGSPREPSKKEDKSLVNDSLDQTRRRKHYPEDLKGVGLARGALGELHKTTSSTAGHDQVESSRRGSFAGQHSLPRDERPLRLNKPTENLPRREGTQKDDQSQSSRPKISPPSAHKQETSRGQRSAYEREGTDRREGAQQELRHRAERFEDAPPPLSAKEYRHPAEKLNASRRGDGDHRGKFPEEEKLRFRQEPLLYRPMDMTREDGPRDSYARYARRPAEPSWPDVVPDPSPYPPGRYLPPRDDPRLPPISRPPETDYAALYYKDLPEWLELTGYHDYSYRQMVLRRQRELRAMEERRMVMEDDREASRGYLTMPPREEIDPRDLRRTRGPPNYPVPPSDDRDPGGRAPEGGLHRSASRAGLYPPVPRHDDWPRYQGDFHIPPPLGEVATRKRRAPFLDDYDDSGPAGKLPRANYESQHRAAIALPPNEHVNAEQSGTHNKHHPSHTELNDHRHPSRRVNKDRLEDPEDETSAVRQSLSKRIAAGRGHELSPPTPQEPRLRKRSLSPARHGYDNNDRKEGIKRERDGPANKFRHDDLDTAFVHPQRKGFDKGRRSPDLSPRYEKEFQKPGRSASGKFTPRDDFRKPFPARRNSSDEYRSMGDIVRRTSIDEHKKKPGFGRGRGRGYNKEFHPSTRYSRGMDHGDAMDIDRRAEIDTRNAETRYFVVKSFNHDNVKMAQKDELWATQKKNSDIFDEAFRTSNRVILVFSVNKSGKFQGYARMESPTGSAPVPTWAKNLLWESSGPFRIRWITINDIGFHRVAHLTNRLNEDQPVLIGRDGQEIDPECGANLCKLIDESAFFHRNYNENGGK